MTDAVDPRRERDLTAAELALGLLKGAERAAAERELLRDPQFRAEYEFWTAKAGEWLEEVPGANDGADGWAAIEAEIDSNKGGYVERRSVARSGGLTRAWAVAATLAALIAIPFAVVSQQRISEAKTENTALARKVALAQGQRQVAQISGEANRVLVSALYDPAAGTIDLKLDVPNKRALLPELWVIPDDGKPRSLGAFTTASARIEVDQSVRPFLTDGAMLAVTLEPADGAPHAAPTGQILGTTTMKVI